MWKQPSILAEMKDIKIIFFEIIHNRDLLIELYDLPEELWKIGYTRDLVCDLARMRYEVKQGWYNFIDEFEVVL